MSAFIFYHGARAFVGLGLFIVEASRSYSDTLHSVGLLWTRDHPDAETSTWQHKSHKRQTSMTSAVFESTIPASERPQIQVLDRAATGIDHVCLRDVYFIMLLCVKKFRLSVEQKFGRDRLVHRDIVTNHVTGKYYTKINSLLHQNIKRHHLHTKTNGCHSIGYKFVSAITFSSYWGRKWHQ
jgi:hypothetical protein